MDFATAVRLAAAHDTADPLARFRAEFYLPPGAIYLDGHSLGLLSRRAESAALSVLAHWGARGIDGWLEAEPRWLDLAERTAAALAPVVGAAPEEIAVTGQTTLNLHQLLATLYDPTHPTRRIILADTLTFASDLHALHSHLRLRGLDPATHLRLAPSRDGRTLDPADLAAALTDDVQLALFPSVLFTSGQRLDVAALTRAARARGVLVGWDLSHSVGAVPHALTADGADFACWCHYKWLNAGPGAVGGLFLAARHHERPPGLAGWWGVRSDRRFRLERAHEPAEGAARLQVGTPPILALAPLVGSLELVAEAGGVAALRAKSLMLTELLLALAEAELTPLGFAIVTPRQPEERGGHVALAHPEAWRICQAAKAAGVVGDFRAPDVLRLAPSPLYTSFGETVRAVEMLAQVVRSGAFRACEAEPGVVT